MKLQEVALSWKVLPAFIGLIALVGSSSCERSTVKPEPPSKLEGAEDHAAKPNVAEPDAPSDEPVGLGPTALAAPSAVAKPPGWQARAEQLTLQLDASTAKQLLEVTASAPQAPEVLCYESLAYFAMTQLLAAAVERDRCLPRLNAEQSAKWNARLEGAKQAASTRFDNMLTATVADRCPKLVAEAGQGVGRCSTCMPIDDFKNKLAATPRSLESTTADKTLPALTRTPQAATKAVERAHHP